MSGADPEQKFLKKRVPDPERARTEIDERLERLLSHQRRLEDRIQCIESNPYFRLLRAIGRFRKTLKQQLGQLLLHSRFQLLPEAHSSHIR